MSVFIIVSYFTDWSVFSVPLLRLISSKRLRQIKSFSAIVTTLLEYRCYPAATCVAERIFSVISSNAHLLPKLKQKDIDSYMDAIISLQMYSEVDKSLILEKYIVPVFTLLTPQQQCQLLVDLQANDNSRLRGSPACLELYKTLTKSLIQSDLCLPPEVVLKVIDCHLHLLRSWIAELEVATASESNAIEFRSNVSECFLFFVREEKKFYSSQTDPNSTLFPNDLFTPLFEKMPVQELARLIWNIYQADVKEVQSLKKFPSVLNVYRKLCQQFVNKCDVMLCELPCNMLVETAKSLLWLGDESFSLFTDKIIAAHRVDKPNCIILKIAESADIRELSDSFPPARESLRRLLELRVSTVTKVLQKEDVWLPEHPKVEKFLRSSDQKMTYANFSSTEEAHQFAIFLCSFGAANGFSVEVQTEGVGYETICKIVKIDWPKSNPHPTELLLSSEKTALEKIIEELKVQPDLGASDVALLDSPCSKKQKLDISFTGKSD